MTDFIPKALETPPAPGVLRSNPLSYSREKGRSTRRLINPAAWQLK